MLKSSKMELHDGLLLANIIKETHKELRKRVKAQDKSDDLIWHEHIQDKTNLHKYALAMHTLATVHWQNRETKTCRIEWIYQQIKSYFYEGRMNSVVTKEKRKLKFLNIDWSFKIPANSEKLLVLDVGSCYNPFVKYEDLAVLPIDLFPAIESVYECDFLALQVKEERSFSWDSIESVYLTSILEYGLSHSCEKFQGSKETGIVEIDTQDNKRQKLCSNKTSITSLPAAVFEVIVFSLFLEYLPSPKQRYLACSKAYDLLKPNGLLCIVTPDSKHETSNVHIYRLWKVSLGKIGFIRMKYEKHQHFHGMVYRKAFHKDSCLGDADKELSVLRNKKKPVLYKDINYDGIDKCIFIPQDFSMIDDT